jgi:4-amino-4-deoxy-L-arabinose transferase-like glycosyltransferase
VGLFVFFAAAACLWLRLNRAPPNWDDAWYLSNSLTLYDAWSDGGLIGLGRAFLKALGFKAPLITALPLPFYWIVGRRWHAAFGVNLAAMAVLFVAVWGIGRRLASARAGVAAPYIAATLPLLYGLSRWYLVEYPLTAAMALLFWAALAAGETEDLLYPAALGVLWGLGLLLKSDFPLFALPVTANVIYRRKDRVRAAIAMAIPCFVLAAPWYALHWRATWENAIAAGFGPSAAVQGTGPVFSAGAVRLYLAMVVERALSGYYAVLAAAAMALAIVLERGAFLRRIAPLALWAAPFLVFLFGGNKDVRYIAPILPAFAIALACALDAAVPNFRWAAVALVFPLVSFFAVSYGVPYRAPDLGYAIRYSRHDWGQDRILTAIAEDATIRIGERKTILLGSDRARFNADNFQLTAAARRLPFRVETTAYAASLTEALTQAERASYFVYKEGGEAESPFFNRYFPPLLTRLRGTPEWREMRFTLRLPDGGTAHILRRAEMQAP